MEFHLRLIENVHHVRVIIIIKNFTCTSTSLLYFIYFYILSQYLYRMKHLHLHFQFICTSEHFTQCFSTIPNHTQPNSSQSVNETVSVTAV